MGRKTYFGIPETKRPLPGRLNIILSNTLEASELPSDVMLCNSLESAMKKIESNPKLNEEIENVWIVGGSGVYKEAMSSERSHRLYLTKIYEKFECDTFFPAIPDDFCEINPSVDKNIPKGMQEENGIKYEYKILEKIVSC